MAFLVLNRRHTTPMLMLILFAGISCFVVFQFLLPVSSHSMQFYSAYYTTALHLQSMTIHQCIRCWQCMFEWSIINALLQFNGTSSSSLTLRNQCPFGIDKKSLLHSESNYQTLALFMNHTEHAIQQSTQSSSWQSDSLTYREMLALRRTIMVFIKFFDLQHALRDNYVSILSTFQAWTQQHRSSNRNSFDKTFFNIHISKSGGTSVCQTFKQLSFAGVTTPDSSVCNYQWLDRVSLSCEQTYERTHLQQYDMVAREVPLDVFDDDDASAGGNPHPKLCDGFIYLLPFRHPFEKSFSWSQGDNVLRPDSRTGFYRLVTDDSVSDAPQLPCLEQYIVINGYKYQRMTKAHHYRHFFVDLFASESTSLSALNDWEQTLQLQQMYKESSNALNVSLPQCMQQTQANQNWIYIFFNQANTPGSTFLMRYRKSQWPFPGLRLPRSSSGNTFTSWLGYGDASQTNQWPLSAQLNPRWMITRQHFLNACDLLLQIDYVLPFWAYLQMDMIGYIRSKYDGQSLIGMSYAAHPIWNLTHRDIFAHFEGKGYALPKERGWIHRGHTKGRDDHVHASKLAENASIDDIQALRKNNVFDLALFRLAQWIATMDVEYKDFSID